MKTVLKIAMVALAFILPANAALQAADSPNWKIGRVYNRLVCNACHRIDGGKVISPYERNRADWEIYFKDDKHATGTTANASALYYMSTEYRKSIMDKNKAAAKFVKTPDAVMSGHIIEFYTRGAKDSDTPARCQ